jgi:hypothetical protein
MLYDDEKRRYGLPLASRTFSYRYKSILDGWRYNLSSAMVNIQIHIGASFLFHIYSLFFQNVFHVESGMIELRNPSLQSYPNLRNVYSDDNYPCSHTSILYGSFVTLVPIYHPICCSQFISQTWIEILVDNMMAFRFAGGFLATAITRFQTFWRWSSLRLWYWLKNYLTIIKEPVTTAVAIIERLWDSLIRINLFRSSLRR